MWGGHEPTESAPNQPARGTPHLFALGGRLETNSVQSSSFTGVVQEANQVESSGSLDAEVAATQTYTPPMILEQHEPNHSYSAEQNQATDPWTDDDPWARGRIHMFGATARADALQAGALRSSSAVVSQSPVATPSPDAMCDLKVLKPREEAHVEQTSTESSVAPHVDSLVPTSSTARLNDIMGCALVLPQRTLTAVPQSSTTVTRDEFELIESDDEAELRPISQIQTNVDVPVSRPENTQHFCMVLNTEELEEKDKDTEFDWYAPEIDDDEVNGIPISFWELSHGTLVSVNEQTCLVRVARGDVKAIPRHLVHTPQNVEAAAYSFTPLNQCPGPPGAMQNQSSRHRERRVHMQHSSSFRTRILCGICS